GGGACHPSRGRHRGSLGRGRPCGARARGPGRSGPELLPGRPRRRAAGGRRPDLARCHRRVRRPLRGSRALAGRRAPRRLGDVVDLGLKDRIERELDGVRRRSIELLDPVPPRELARQHSPLMSPLVWDLAHVGNYEEQWLLGSVAATRVAPHLDEVYDAFLHPRRDRPALPLLAPDEARRYVGDVRARALDVLERVDLEHAAPLLDQGLVYGMVVQHEQQHDETMTATIQLWGAGDYPLPEPAPVAPPAAPLPAEVLVAGGRFVIGTDLEPWAYDNERPAHAV